MKKKLRKTCYDILFTGRIETKTFKYVFTLFYSLSISKISRFKVRGVFFFFFFLERKICFFRYMQENIFELFIEIETIFFDTILFVYKTLE